jgi:glycosidase
MRLMKTPSFLRLPALLAAICLAAIAFTHRATGSQSTPEAIKVEPPNWWAGQSIGGAGNPLRLLVRGRNLGGARVESARRGVRVSNPKVSDAGTWLFIDVRIDRRAVPGSYPIKISTANGSVEAPFEITPALPRAGNFQGFNQDDVIYLLMPDRFANGDASNDDPAVSKGLLDRGKSRFYHGGDLQGVIDKLPYLKDLGVTALWLNPIYDNNNRLNERETYNNQAITDYHGYGAVDFYAVEEHFGDVRKFRQLVEAAHKQGLKIIQDQVANHSGPYHVWAKDLPTPTWLNGTEAKHPDNNWQTHLLMDPHATDELRRPVLDGWFINILPDLNQNDPEAARYITQNTLWWIGMTGLDAIRQDTLPYVPRRFWRDWMTAIKRDYPNVNVVGETLDGLPAQVAFFQGGATRFDGIDSRIDTEFDYPLFYPIRRVFAEGQSMRQLVGILNQDYLYPAPQRLVTLLGSHDVSRFMNEKGATIEGLKLAFTFLLSVRGIPQLYYGDEIAMRGGNDPDNRRDFPGGWPGDPRNAFDPAGRTAEEQNVFEHLKKALRLRAELEPLRRGRMVHLAINDRSYAFARVTDQKTVIVAFNNHTQPETIEAAIPRDLKLADGTVMRNRLGSVAEVRIENGRVKFTLAPRAAVILE